MKVQVFFLDGEIQEFDPGHSMAYSNLLGASCEMPLFTLRHDDGGLWLVVDYYDVGNCVSIGGSDSRPSPRVASHTKCQLLDPTDFERLAWVVMDGRKIFQRVGDSVVDLVKFDAYSAVLSSVDPNAPMNVKAVELFYSLCGNAGFPGAVYPGNGEGDLEYHTRVAEMMGWDYKTLRFVIDAYEAGIALEDSESESGTPGLKPEA